MITVEVGAGVVEEVEEEGGEVVHLLPGEMIGVLLTEEIETDHLMIDTSHGDLPHHHHQPMITETLTMAETRCACADLGHLGDIQVVTCRLRETIIEDLVLVEIDHHPGDHLERDHHLQEGHQEMVPLIEDHLGMDHHQEDH